jgi:hypothetical protein
MMRLALACALLTLLLCFGSTAGAASQGGCKAFKFKDNGIPWAAKQIRIKGTTCKAAKALIRSYAHPRNCRLQAPCHIKGYKCRTTNSHDSTFRETCRRPGRLVRWVGSYSST